MGTVVLLIDNSNIFIAGKEEYDDASARFDYSEFEKICAGNDTIVEKHIAGSTPPSNDKFWTRMEKNGYKVHTYERVPAGYGHAREKGVDMILGMQGTRAIEKLKPSRVILLTGDADFIPIAQLRDDIKAEEGVSFILDVWAFSNSMSPVLEEVSDNVYKIDEIDGLRERLIYFQGQDGRRESFNDHYARIAEEERQKREAALKTAEEREAALKAAEEREAALKAAKEGETALKAAKEGETALEKVKSEKGSTNVVETVGLVVAGVVGLGALALSLFCGGFSDDDSY